MRKSTVIMLYALISSMLIVASTIFVLANEINSFVGSDGTFLNPTSLVWAYRLLIVSIIWLIFASLSYSDAKSLEV